MSQTETVEKYILEKAVKRIKAKQTPLRQID